MLYDYRVVMEFTPTGSMFPSLTTRYHFTSALMVYTLLLSVEVMQINKQTNKQTNNNDLDRDIGGSSCHRQSPLRIRANSSHPSPISSVVRAINRFKLLR